MNLGLRFITGAMNPGVGAARIAAFQNLRRRNRFWMFRPLVARPKLNGVSRHQVPRLHFRTQSSRRIREDNHARAHGVKGIDRAGDFRIRIALVEMQASRLQDDGRLVAGALDEPTLVAEDRRGAQVGDIREQGRLVFGVEQGIKVDS